MMKSLAPVLCLFLAVGCAPQDRSSANVGAVVEVDPASYTVLAEPPDAALDDIAANFALSQNDSKLQLLGKSSSSAIDGQSAIQLLETACYADVICHSVEYPLRVATLDFVRENLDSSDVRNAINWVRTSYASELPLDAAGDETGQFKGMLVQSMKIRMTEYANELLQPDDAKQSSK